jgi:hypothetical protein
LQYIIIFIFWRLVRYAKYAAMGALVAAVAGTAIGSVASGAAFFIAPPDILSGAGLGVLWAVGRFGWRRARARMETAQRERVDPREDEKADAEGEPPAGRAPERMLRGDPW